MLLLNTRSCVFVKYCIKPPSGSVALNEKKRRLGPILRSGMVCFGSGARDEVTENSSPQVANVARRARFLKADDDQSLGFINGTSLLLVILGRSAVVLLKSRVYNCRSPLNSIHS